MHFNLTDGPVGAKPSLVEMIFFLRSHFERAIIFSQACHPLFPMFTFLWRKSSPLWHSHGDLEVQIVIETVSMTHPFPGPRLGGSAGWPGTLAFLSRVLTVGSVLGLAFRTQEHCQSASQRRSKESMLSLKHLLSIGSSHSRLQCSARYPHSLFPVTLF